MKLIDLCKFHDLAHYWNISNPHSNNIHFLDMISWYRQVIWIEKGTYFTSFSFSNVASLYAIILSLFYFKYFIFVLFIDQGIHDRAVHHVQWVSWRQPEADLPSVRHQSRWFHQYQGAQEDRQGSLPSPQQGGQSRGRGPRGASGQSFQGKKKKKDICFLSSLPLIFGRFKENIKKYIKICKCLNHYNSYYF